MSHDIEQHNTAPSATRRTVLTGAAWSVPVIAAASLAPLAAASDTVTLAFDKSTYNGTACGTISGAYVTVTVNGVATAGKSVTTTLSAGYKFSGGSASYTGVSDGSGKVALPSIAVPGQGGQSVLKAMHATTTATSTAAAPAASKAHSATASGSNSTYSGIPGTAVPIGGAGWFLDGTTLYYFNAVYATGVSSAVGVRGNGIDYVTYMQNGKAHSVDSAGGNVTSHSVPSTAIPVGGWGWFLDGTTLYYFDAVYATGVSSAVGTSIYGVDYVSFMQSGKAHAANSSGSNVTYNAIPSTAVPVGGAGWFLDGETLYYFNTVYATGVTSAVGTRGLNIDYVTYMQNGKAHSVDSAGGNVTSNSVPSTAIPVGGWGWFLDGTNLYSFNNVFATGVTHAKGASVGGTDYVSFMQGAC
ncbi:hypothetical protein P2P98_02145 [Microbacterium sp. Kw_RZR3]|uniref:hypothetical protein n=1 Tax=Microbacterium sp. Kw_RZR3 TaxID=3032903 RepID=UPI0023DA908D|nr:hypothetical protein [Microbacterium sp. Kw_RZR3]MDF2044948.1 hypothetical protein [Microbacterium sp. Kw_RZR3]